MVPADVLVAILRVLVGLLFIGHGAQKLFGWFGGHGIAGHVQFIRSLGFRPATLWAWINALAEFVGGILLVLGLLTPVGAALAVGSMLVAIARVHGPRGLWVANGGYEYNLVLLANALFAALYGPVTYALDAHISYPWAYNTLFIVSFVIMLIGVAAALLTTEEVAQPQPQATSQAS